MAEDLVVAVTVRVLKQTPQALGATPDRVHPRRRASLRQASGRCGFCDRQKHDRQRRRQTPQARSASPMAPPHSSWVFGDADQPLVDSQRSTPLHTPVGDVPRRKAGFWQTVFNVVNLYVGLGLLSKPYAVKLGGWLSLGLLALVVVVFCLTAKMLVWCFDATNPLGVKVAGHSSFSKLGESAYGKTGRSIVSTLVILEFVGVLTMDLIIYWRQIEALFPHVGLNIIIPICSIPTVLTVLVDNYARLSFISMLGTFASCFLVACMLFVIARDPTRAHIKAQFADDPTFDLGYTLLDVQKLPLAVGIFIVSLAGHSYLPAMRGAMKDPTQFGAVLNVSFVFMLFIYSSMACAGYWYFGNSSEVLITSNIRKSSTSAFGKRLNDFVTCSVALASFSTIAPIVAVLMETLEDASGGKPLKGVRRYAARLTILGIGTGIACISLDYLGYFEAIVGGVCSTSISLLLPVLFYGKLYAWQHTFKTKVFLVVCVGLAMLMVLAMFTMDLYNIAHAP